MFRSNFHNGPMIDRTPRVGDHSPWGPIQQVYPLLDGVTMVSTARHGGMHLSARRLATMPESMRSEDGWYEEDYEVAMPLFCFHHEFVKLSGVNISPRDQLAQDIKRWCGLEV